MTPSGILNFQREVELNHDPDADPEGQGRVLDILNSLRVEEGTSLDNPRTQPLNETRDQAGAFAEDDLTSEMHQRTQSQLFNAEKLQLSTDPQQSARLRKTENGNQNLLPDCQLTWFGGGGFNYQRTLNKEIVGGTPLLHSLLLMKEEGVNGI